MRGRVKGSLDVIQFKVAGLVVFVAHHRFGDAQYFVYRFHCIIPSILQTTQCSMANICGLPRKLHSDIVAFTKPYSFGGMCRVAVLLQSVHYEQQFLLRGTEDGGNTLTDFKGEPAISMYDGQLYKDSLPKAIHQLNADLLQYPNLKEFIGTN
jgi:hypothetical protein